MAGKLDMSLFEACQMQIFLPDNTPTKMSVEAGVLASPQSLVHTLESKIGSGVDLSHAVYLNYLNYFCCFFTSL